MPPQEEANVRRIFNLARQDVAGYEAYAGQIARLFMDNPAMLEDILDGLFEIAKADGVLHPGESAFLERVAEIFGFAPNEFRRIRASHFAPELTDPYVILGLSYVADEEEIRQTYRRLVRENHPDSLIARGVPEEFVKLANDKLAAINARLCEDPARAGPEMKLVECPSPNHDARGGAPIDMLVLHYTGMETAEAALSRLCDPARKVSAHYTIDRDGEIYAHVPEARRAWHAGVSWWAGERDVNARSIGIELVNPGHEFGYVKFSEPQMAALIDLARGILKRHPIPACACSPTAMSRRRAKRIRANCFHGRSSPISASGFGRMIGWCSANPSKARLFAFGYGIRKRRWKR